MIGKQGATIKRLCEESGAYIQVQEDHESRGGVREVYICDDSGGMGSSAKAKELVTRMVKDEEKRQAERRRGGGGSNGRGRSGNRKNARGRGGGRGRPKCSLNSRSARVRFCGVRESGRSSSAPRRQYARCAGHSDKRYSLAGLFRVSSA